ncbi:CXXC motif containing zinc binding protein, eukaryotic [Popillia japonica]|uniref:CXXC motif containing zinc binding protein, eukaryotic n=1 Tax=Popillia japonica TaxID=7064 RepID=A0AAW1L6L5_POPJA
MVRISLQIKATLENIDVLRTCHPNYNFLLKLKCLNCGEISNKWHDVIESQTQKTKTGKSETHFLAKCKLCGRENNLDILEGTNGKYTGDDSGNFKGIVTFDCRGIEPVEFMPGGGWIAEVEESGKKFNDVDLSEKEWVEYDDKLKQSVGIYEFESQFIKWSYNG